MPSNSLNLMVVVVWWTLFIVTASITVQQTIFDMCDSCDGSSMPSAPVKELETPSLTYCAWMCKAGVPCQAIRFNVFTAHCQLWDGRTPASGNNYTVFVRS